MTANQDTKPDGVVTFNYNEHQDIANAMLNDMLEILRIAHKGTQVAFGNGDEEAGDAMPIIQGALGGIFAFMIEGGCNDETIRDVLDQTFGLVPQLRTNWTLAHTAGVA